MFRSWRLHSRCAAQARQPEFRDRAVLERASIHRAVFVTGGITSDDIDDALTGDAVTLVPARVGDLFEREERCVELSGDYAAVAAYVAEHATPSA